MRYSPELLDEIRARLPVSRIVERRVKLRRAGREYQGLSPFKTERSPSFTVNDQKGFYHCFASGEHGDIFTFLMKTEGLTFPEAVDRLAAEAGVVLPDPAPIDEVKASHESRMRDAVEEACRFFEAALSSKEGAGAREYLAKRGVQSEEIKAFRLGYAPNSKSSLRSHLAGKGFSLEEMEDAGLLIHGEDIPTSYDRFRGRLIFPIADTKNRVIAFGGRALLPDQQPKYLNSPDTPLFHKGKVLFNFAAAREAARKTGSVIVAEGYMDVIALKRGGFPNAVAPLGTALTEDQLRLLWSMAGVPTLCFDGDSAGQKAASRALDGALPFLEPQRSLQFVILPEGQDPDDMVSKGAKETLAALLEQPTPLFDFLWKREEERTPLNTPELRASFETRLMELAEQVAHKTLRFHYISSMRQRLKSRENSNSKRNFVRQQQSPDESWRARSSAAQGKSAARRKGIGAPGVQPSGTESLLKSAAARPDAGAGAAREALLVKALLNHPWLLDDYAEEIAAIAFDDPGCAAIRDALLALHQSDIALDNENVLEHLSKHGRDRELERIGSAISHQADENFNPGAAREAVLQGWHHVMQLHTRANVLEKALREAEDDYLRNQSDENFFRLCAIKQQVEIALV